jgi:hypothetical protein
MKAVLRAATKLLSIAAFVIVMLALILSTQLGRRAFAQATGYRFTANGYVGVGQFGMLCFEPYLNAGPDNCLIRMGSPNSIGISQNGTPAGEYGLISAPPAVTVNNAGSGGSIAAGTYRAAATYITALGGETTISADGSSTTAPSGGASTITITAPIAAAGAVGWAPYLSPAAGAANSELSQPVISASNVPLCTGAFQVFTISPAFQPTQGDRPSRWVCPFGQNWTITTQPLTAVTTVFSTTAPVGPANAPQSGTQTLAISYAFGYAVPGQNTAGFPEVIPSIACNFIPTTALASVTTAQTAASCPLTAGLQNVLGKELEITGEFVYTSSAGSGAPVVAIVEGGITPITITCTTQTGTTANSQLAFDYVIDTSAVGTAGTLEAHGQCEAGVGASLTESKTIVRDSNSAASSAINLTAQNTILINLSDATSLTAATLRHAKVIVLN